MSFTWIPNDDLENELAQDRGNNQANATSPAVYYLLVGGGMFVYDELEVRYMQFDRLEKVRMTNSVNGLRDNYLRSHHGYDSSESVSMHNLSVRLSNITQEEINMIRQLGGTVSLSQQRGPGPGGHLVLPLYFYFISNSFTE